MTPWSNRKVSGASWVLTEAVPQHPKRRTRGLRTPWATGLLHDAIWRCARLDLGTDREAAICDRAIPGVVIVAVADKRAAVFVQDFLNVGRKVAHAALGGAMLSELGPSARSQRRLAWLAFDQIEDHAGQFGAQGIDGFEGF